MAIKVKRKSAAKEEVEQDQIYTASKGIFNYIEDNRVHLGIGLGALLLAIIIMSAMSGRSKARTQEGGSAVFANVQTAIAAVGDDPLAPDDEPRFESVSARSEAVRAGVAPIIADGDPPPVAMLLDGSAAASLGETDSALESLSSLGAGEGTPALVAVASLGVASLEVDAGNLSTARSSLEGLSDAVPDLASYVQYELARMTEATGDLEGARAMYAAFAEGGSDPLAPAAQAELVRSAEFRANLLSVALGQPAEEATDEPSGDESDDSEASNDGGEGSSE